MGSRAIKGRYHVKARSSKVVVISILGVLAAIIVAAAIGTWTLVDSWLDDLPDYSNANALNTSSTSVVYASDGTTVLAEFQLENRDPVSYDEISPYVLAGTVACEDERFYSHSGVDLIGTARALVNNLTGGSLEGGSTITQQLVRNTLLSDEMTDISLKRKVREMYLALKVEEMYSKDDILLMYLNTINYGSGAYGIEAASERYFSKHASDLTLAEATALIGIPQSPNNNDPIDHMENCLDRRKTVLARMVSNGMITQEEADEINNKKLKLKVKEISNSGIKKYPYFTSYVRNQLLNEDGKYAFNTAELFKGGLKIVTTLDVDDQKDAEQAALDKEAQAGSIYEVAMVAMDPDTGYIRAMVGGKDYNESQINMATGEGSSGRQCGSSFKTFTLTSAIEQGINPETVIDAGYSVKLKGSDAVVYNSGKASYGTISIKQALAVSSNTAFTRLIMSVGVDKVKSMAQRLGITSAIQDTAGITLGIDSVTPLEMANAYSTIANGGTKYSPECILTIEDAYGNVIVDNSNPTGEQVISKEVARAVIDCLEGVVEEGTGTQARLTIDQVAAGKTGTTDDSKDSWFVGFTPQLCSAFWLGERVDNYADAHVVPTTVASAFSQFMSAALKGKATQDFFTADSPKYDDNYSDADNHIGSVYWNYDDDSYSDESSSYYDDYDDDYSYNNSDYSDTNTDTDTSETSNKSSSGSESSSSGKSSSGSSSSGDDSSKSKDTSSSKSDSSPSSKKTSSDDNSEDSSD